jgi:MGT family glycosyltransferase
MGRRALLVTWDGGGNVGVALALAAQLREAGWEVAAHGPASLATPFGAAGVRYLARGPAEASPSPSASSASSTSSSVPGADPWDPTAMALDARAACERLTPDVAVVDYMLPGALCGAEAAGVPVAALVHTLYAALVDDADPPPYPAPMAMAATPEAVATARAELGLRPVPGLGGLLARCARVLVTCTPVVDRPAASLPDNVRYVGPLVAGPGPDAGWSPPPGEGPLVVVSLGTTAMDEGPVLARVVRSLTDAPVRVLAQPGAHLGPADRSDAAGGANVTVSPFVGHAAVLPHAGALVTHAGLGTVLAGLSAGVPMVCVPLGREQPANAAAVARLGAGVVLPRDAPAADIRAAVLEVLADPSYRSAATRASADLASWPQARSALAELTTITDTAIPTG